MDECVGGGEYVCEECEWMSVCGGGEGSVRSVWGSREICAMRGETSIKKANWECVCVWSVRERDTCCACGIDHDV